MTDKNSATNKEDNLIGGSAHSGEAWKMIEQHRNRVDADNAFLEYIDWLATSLSRGRIDENDVSNLLQEFQLNGPDRAYQELTKLDPAYREFDATQPTSGIDDPNFRKMESFLQHAHAQNFIDDNQYRDILRGTMLDGQFDYDEQMDVQSQIGDAMRASGYEAILGPLGHPTIQNEWLGGTGLNSALFGGQRGYIETINQELINAGMSPEDAAVQSGLAGLNAGTGLGNSALPEHQGALRDSGEDFTIQDLVDSIMGVEGGTGDGSGAGAGSGADGGGNAGGGNSGTGRTVVSETINSNGGRVVVYDNDEYDVYDADGSVIHTGTLGDGGANDPNNTNNGNGDDGTNDGGSADGDNTNTGGGLVERILNGVRYVLRGDSWEVADDQTNIPGTTTGGGTNTGGGGNTGGGSGNPGNTNTDSSIIVGPDGQQYILRDGQVINEQTGEVLGDTNDPDTWSIFNPPGGGWGNDNGRFDLGDIFQAPADLLSVLFGGGSSQPVPGSATATNTNVGGDQTSTNTNVGGDNTTTIGDTSTGDQTVTNDFAGMLDGLLDGLLPEGMGQTILNAGFNELQRDYLKDANEDSREFAAKYLDYLDPFRTTLGGQNNLDALSASAQTTPDLLDPTAQRFSGLNDPTTDVSIASGLTGMDSGTRDANAPDAIRTAVNQEPAFDYANDPGYQFLRKEGMRDIMDSAAARGKLSSGETMTRLQDRGTGLAATYAPMIENINRGRDATQLRADQQYFGQDLTSNQFADMMNRSDFGENLARRGQEWGENYGTAQFDLGQDQSNIANMMGVEGMRFGQDQARNSELWQDDLNAFNKLSGLVGMGLNAASNQASLGSGLVPWYGESLGQDAAMRQKQAGNIFRDIFGGF